MQTSDHLILVTGAARSGKSEWAETLAIHSQQTVIYIATAELDPSDLEWQARVESHRRRRPPEWQTLQVPIHLAATIQQTPQNHCLLVDSLGTWLANLLAQDDHFWQQTMTELLISLKQVQCQVILVAEEVGWGVVPAYPLGRTFRDRLGTLVRRIGTMADVVYLVTGGHVLNLSHLGFPLDTNNKLL